MSSKTYRIRPGYTFRDSDDKLKEGGDTIQLSDDVAETVKERVDLVEGAAEAAVPDEEA